MATLRSLSFFLFLFLLLACTQKGEGPSTGVDAGLAAACNVFPHPSGWSSSTSHGVCVLQSGSQTCLKCHKQSSDKTEIPATCTSCHPLYPHESNWKQKEKHGQYVLDNGKSNCATQCHGTDFMGGLSGVSCFDCHPDYPHLNPNWVNGAGRDRVHAMTFIAKFPGNNAVCTTCHGNNYNRELASKSCLTCHPDGVTHRNDWNAGSKHGVYFSGKYQSWTPVSVCWDCHGSPVKFNDLKPLANNCMDCHAFHTSFTTDQSKTVLSQKSDCYTCHWGYPHIGYEFPGESRGWGPLTDSSPPNNIFHPFKNYGHLYYVTRSPLFTMADGTRPGFRWTESTAVLNTCGESECHFAGRRPAPLLPDNRCNDYCHIP